MNNIINISGYKFVSLPLEELNSIRTTLRKKALELNLKGTIILSVEGINIFLAGTREQIDSMAELLESYAYFRGIWLKESLSDYQPFKKLFIKIKNEIIPMGVSDIRPDKDPAPYISPEELKKWYDEGRQMIILDTRNSFEIKYGKFSKSIELNIKHFVEFNNAVDQLYEKYNNTPIITCCTGGIRCEKAAPLMLKKGFKKVYQLEGGILNYFEKVGGEHYEGQCFVFDERETVDSNLKARREI